MIGAIMLSKLINRQCLGAVISPWEVGQLDEVWLDVFRGLAYGTQSYVDAEKRAAQLKSDWLKRTGYYLSN